MSIAGKIIDIYDNPSLSIAKKYREKLAGVSVLDPIDVDKLSNDKFALIIKTAKRTIRKFPLNNEDSIKLSKCYFNEVKNTLHPDLVKVAESGFKGEPNIIDVTKLSNEQPVTLEWSGYNLSNSVHVKEASDRFAYTTENMHAREKYAYANAIYKEAKKYDIEVSDPIRSYVGQEINSTSVKIGCQIRKQHLFDSGLKSDLDKLAEDPSPEKFVEFDKVAGLTSYVEDNKIPDGYATCYAEKKASSLDESIKNISPSVIQRIFDAEFAKEWANDPVAVYKSLPDPTKAMIDKQVEGAQKIIEKTAFKIGDKIPAATLMLAGVASAYAAGLGKGAKGVIDKQLEAYGFVPSKQNGILYEKDNQKIVKIGDVFAVIDKDNLIMHRSRSISDLAIHLGST